MHEGGLSEEYNSEQYARSGATAEMGGSFDFKQ
jgi:hypothetical protein